MAKNKHRKRKPQVVLVRPRRTERPVFTDRRTGQRWQVENTRGAVIRITPVGEPPAAQTDCKIPPREGSRVVWREISIRRFRDDGTFI